MLSYTEMAVTVAEADAYAESRGHADWLAEADEAKKEAALRRGQDYIAGRYNSRWAVRFANDDAPEPVKYAICEAARLEMSEPGALTPVQERGGRLQSVTAGPVSVTFAAGAPAETTISVIDNLLAGILRSASSAVGWVARA